MRKEKLNIIILYLLIINLVTCFNFNNKNDYIDVYPNTTTKTSGVNGAPDNTPPGNVTLFTATTGDTQINLSWTNPSTSDFAGVKILRKTGSYPVSSTDGTVVYSSSGTSFADSGLTNGTQYFYTAYAFDLSGNFDSGMQASAKPLAGIVNAPSFSPVAGAYNSAQNVTLSTTTVGALICYRTDAGIPICNAFKNGCIVPALPYSTPVNIAVTSTMKAIACRSGLTDSGISSAVFTIDLTPPGNITAFSATPNNAQISLTWSNPSTSDFAGVKILRKTGSYPVSPTDGTATVVYNSSGTSNTDASVSNGTQYFYKAYAYDAVGNYDSGVQATATPSAGLVNAPTLSPVGGLYNSAQNVTLSTTTGGSIICYRTDATNPICDAPKTGCIGPAVLYSGPVNIAVSSTLKAIACKFGSTDSSLSSGTYTIDMIPPGNVTSFVTNPSNAQIALSWANPSTSDFAGVKILRKTGSYPVSPTDGTATVVYNSNSTSTVDVGVTNGTQYYYTAYSYDNIGNYDSGVQATTTPTAGIVNTPTFSPIAGTYNAVQSITISTTTGGAIICYRTDATNPSCNASKNGCIAPSVLYTTLVNIAVTSTLKAIACKFGSTDSSISSAVYTIDMTPPGNVTSFVVSPSNAQIALSWANPSTSDFAGVKILRKTGSYPVSSTDGSVVYNANGTSFADTGLINGTQYFYTAYAYDAVGNYDSGMQATATPIANTNSLQNGPRYSDPFGDGTTLSGLVTVYNNKLHFGSDSTNAFLFQTNLSLAATSTITLDADNGLAGNQVFGPPLIEGGGNTLQGADMIFAGCYDATPPHAATSLSGTACTGAGGSEYLFITGYITTSVTNGYQSSWHTTGTVPPYVFTHITGLSNMANLTYRAMSITIFKGWIYQVAQHQLGSFAPRWVRFKPSYINAGCDDGVVLADCVGMSGRFLNRIGESILNAIVNGQNPNNLGVNTLGGLIAIDVMYEYDNDGAGANESQLYIASGGSCINTNGGGNDCLTNMVRNVTTQSDGGVLRTYTAINGTVPVGSSESSTFASPPSPCDGVSNTIRVAKCAASWEDVTPTSTTWNRYMSIPLPKDARGDGVCSTITIGNTEDWDCLEPQNKTIPAIKAIPQMATFNGALYMIRNACSTVNTVTLSTTIKKVCPLGSERPQLWKLPAGTTTISKGSADWVFIGSPTSFDTRMYGATWLGGSAQATKVANNTELTLLVVNGNRLYIGFDNATAGVNIWRTKAGVTDVTAESDFEAVCQTGNACSTSSLQFGLGGGDKKIISNKSINDAGTDRLIFTTYTPATPMRIYVTENN